jgi:hypothetical protein
MYRISPLQAILGHSRGLIMCFIGMYLTACSIFRPTVDPELAPYVAKWQKSHEYSYVDVRFGTVYGYAIGQCQYGYAHSRKVVIDRVWWETASKLSKYRLISHELGHCVQGLPHSNDPKDVMYPMIEGAD